MPNANVIDHVRAFVTGDDAERLAKRREIKTKLAELESLADRQRAIGKQIVGLRQADDADVNEHQKKTGPIQERLAAIDDENAELRLDGKPVSDRLVKERAQLLDELAAANSKLEASIECSKKRCRALEKEHAKLDVDVRQLSSVRGQLAGRGVANPELLLQRFSAEQHHYWANNRSAAAQQELQRVQEALDREERTRQSRRYRNSRGGLAPDPGPTEHELKLAHERDGWLTEVKSAEQALTAALENRARIRQAILDE